MIEIYTWKTPNGYKPLILLEELEIEYEIKPIPLDGTQKTDNFLLLSPNGKIPAMKDIENNFTLFESGAILLYLAEKYDKFIGDDAQSRYRIIEWLMFQMGGVGPMFGQLGYFKFSAKEDIPYAVERYWSESRRLCEVMDIQLSQNDYIAGSQYCIADMALYPWIKALSNQEGFLDGFDSLRNWMNTIEQREAVKRAYNTSLENI